MGWTGGRYDHRHSRRHHLLTKPGHRGRLVDVPVAECTERTRGQQQFKPLRQQRVDDVHLFVPNHAFGISFNTFATSTGSYTLTTDLGDVAQSYSDPFPGFATGQFAGFVSTAPFTTVVITPQDDFAYNLDDLTYVAAQDVPEPATLLLVGVGLGLARGRFRKSA